MFYFIPSWYNNNRRWYDTSTAFYRETISREFDDTIHQLRIFQQTKENINLLILNYSPNIRYFLNRQKIKPNILKSIFDIIQNTEQVSQNIIKIDDLYFGENVEYIYTFFLIIVKKAGKKIASINFADEGYILTIDFFEDDKIIKKYVFDDRGFLSSILYYKENKEYYQEYLNKYGIWQIREYLEENNKKVEINEKSDTFFLKKEYTNIEELIIEKLNETIKENATIIFSANNIHDELIINSANKNNKLVCSFFEDRSDLVDINKKIGKYNIVVVDSLKNKKLLEEKLEKEESKNKIKHISPYDTRIMLGKSQRKKELIIYLVVDNLEEKELQETLLKLYNIMLLNKNINLILGTYGKKYPTEFLENYLDNICSEYFDDKISIYKEEKFKAENKVDEIENNNKILKIEISEIKTELDLIKTLEYVRLILNIGNYPDMFTTIIGISTGLPQINKIENEYVENYKNGIIINNIDSLEQAINYYFNSLENWNKSLVYSVEKILKYNSTEIVEEWKKILKE